MTRVLGRAALCCVLLLPVLTGCGDADQTGPGVEPSAPTSSTTSSEPTEDATTAPAGPVLEAVSASVAAPEGWKLDRRNSEINLRADAPGPGNGFVGLYDFGPVPGVSLRVLARLARQNFSLPPDGRKEITLDGELDGERAYVLTGSYSTGIIVDVGAVHDGTAVSVSFDLPRRVYTASERQALIDSVLATFEWS